MRVAALGAVLLLLPALGLPLPARGLPPRAQEVARAHEPERLLEVGRAARASAATHGATELKVVSYNIRWRGGEELQRLIRLLREDPEIGGADIVGLQEVDRDKKRTRNTNTVRLIAEALGMNYVWAAPPAGEDGGEEETGVALLSPHALTEPARLVLPHEGPNGRRRAAVGATVLVGRTPVRAYSVHAETRMPLEKKLEHWRAVLDDLDRHPRVAHAMVVGDFNTIKGKDVRAARRLFEEAGFTTPFADDRSTWRTFIIDLKLDWVWLRGFEHAEHGIDKEVGLSDHWPLWARVRIENGRRPAGAEADAASAGQSR